MKKIAAVTMVYNEPEFLPLWVSYYSSQVGSENCYVIDHGTDDGSIDINYGINIIRLPRSPQDDVWRVKLVSNIVAKLLDEYTVVVHTDVDEIVFADPRQYSSLEAYSYVEAELVISAYGFELIQAVALETEIDFSRPILAQRQWVRFTSPMCKPVMVRQPVSWAPGFHCTNRPIVFGGLFLFHLRWFDFRAGLSRLQRTRIQLWADQDAARWQRVTDIEFKKLFLNMTQVPHDEGCSFYPFDPILKNAVERVINSQIGREDQLYKISLEIYSSEAWRVPKAFKKLF